MVLKHKLNSWIHHRIPRDERQTLSHGNLFIMPTRFGYMYMLSCTLLFVIGTNYENNPILILCYFLLSMFFLSIYSCFFNLHGSTFSLDRVAPCHKNDLYRIPIRISNNSHSLGWYWSIEGEHRAVTYSNPAHDSVTISIKATTRGRLFIPDIKLETRYPFGLFVCWSYLRFNSRHWVYPATAHGHWQLSGVTRSDSNEVANRYSEQETNPELEDNFEGIKPYSPGQPLSRVSWKHQAKQPDSALVIKAFSGDPNRQNWLTLESVFGTSLEQKLSVLAHAVLTLEREQQAYGLNLTGDAPIPPDCGAKHLICCLQALALYRLNDAIEHQDE